MMKSDNRKQYRYAFIAVITVLMILAVGHTAVRAEGSSIYLVPEADTRVYGESELALMPAQVACYAKNEIFARHGRRFVSAELNEWFSQQSWYNGTIDPADFPMESLNETEQMNVIALEKRERAASYDGGGYALDTPGYSFDAVNKYLGQGDFNIMQGLWVGNDNGMTVMDTDYFTLYIPSEYNVAWVQQSCSNVEFYYPPARETGMGGRLLSLCAFDENNTEYLNYPSYFECGRTGGKVYVAVFPTDVQFDPSYPEQAEAFDVLYAWADSIRNAGSSPLALKTRNYGVDDYGLGGDGVQEYAAG